MGNAGAERHVARVSPYAAMDTYEGPRSGIDLAPLPRVNPVSRHPGPGRVPRLLVVDDEAPVRRMLLDVFRSFGYDVVAAASGDEALRLFAEADYDVLVTDLLMPGMNGWEVIERLRQAAPRLPVIMLTGSGPDIDLERVRREGVTLVHKPATLPGLRAVLRDVLAARGADR